MESEDGMGAGRVLVHLRGPDGSLSKPMVKVRHGLIEVSDFELLAPDQVNRAIQLILVNFDGHLSLVLGGMSIQWRD